MARIDALPTRERLLLMLALLGAVAFAFHWILLQPVMVQNRQLVQRAESQAQALQEIQRRIET
ncbi:hypothetical protein P0Q08_08515, partial [Campylobacter jejuni]|uniref:hypothetical protein n=1 Tax=Campylobacter jejuni TaxID=197 RepID=UPI002FBEFC9E